MVWAHCKWSDFKYDTCADSQLHRNEKTLFPLERKQVSAQEIQLDVMGNGFSSESTNPEMLT